MIFGNYAQFYNHILHSHITFIIDYWPYKFKLYMLLVFCKLKQLYQSSKLNFTYTVVHLIALQA
jgi:hypothetical protein